MAFLFLHEHVSPYGWKGVVFAAILVFVMVRVIGFLADRKLKRLPGYKKRRPQKKGIRR
jgi:drug/metabolite transporter (DMT)-like permease